MGLKICQNCNGKCCKHIALEIDTPKTKEDFENIRWFVAHKNVNVYVDEDGAWHVEFLTPCKFLGKNNLCKIYGQRPEICKEYDQNECVFHNDYEEKHTFSSLADVDKFIAKKFKKK